MKRLQLKSRHGWWMMICCGAMLLGFLFLSSDLGGGWGGYLLILLCPLMHLIMHSRHSGKDSATCHKETEQVQPTSPDEHSSLSASGGMPLVNPYRSDHRVADSNDIH